ncbi:FAD:protein FMN transferase [Daejeonella oryzae]|uniref:FAD:protein FMN transferase n=1 Tax=Daejeonella oryzae TaxID=1122943 RepID=UPI0009DBB3F4|nr:FAD:protein FMN transferase [Daejeonella oryzae]
MGRTSQSQSIRICCPDKKALIQIPSALSDELILFKKVLKLMGNRFEISVLSDNNIYADDCIQSVVVEIQRIESLLTTFREDSETNLINKYAGISPVKVCSEIYDLICRCRRISELTQGAFDITYGSIDKRFWNFDLNMTELPDAELAKETVRLVNYRNIILNDQNKTVFLKEKGMRIGFGGIGKGYAAERAKLLLKHQGIKSGIVNAAGDLTAWGFQSSGQPWTIGIADPESRNQPFSTLNITDAAVATSGNYEKFAVIRGKKYSHTIDPKTGFPVSGIKSVTIICPNAEFADAMATPVMIMGAKVGLGMINQMQKIACIIIDDSNQIHTSNNIKLAR